jgi:hypothetical protein
MQSSISVSSSCSRAVCSGITAAAEQHSRCLPFCCAMAALAQSLYTIHCNMQVAGSSTQCCSPGAALVSSASSSASSSSSAIVSSTALHALPQVSAHLHTHAHSTHIVHNALARHFAALSVTAVDTLTIQCSHKQGTCWQNVCIVPDLVYVRQL